MSYMYLVLQPDHGGSDDLLLLEVPVDWADGRFVATGPAVPRAVPDSDLHSMLHGHEDDGLPMDAVPLPEGWRLASKHWQPGRYVPSSKEVRSHAVREAVRHLLGRGLITQAFANQILEDNDA